MTEIDTMKLRPALDYLYWKEGSKIVHSTGKVAVIDSTGFLVDAETRQPLITTAEHDDGWRAA